MINKIRTLLLVLVMLIGMFFAWQYKQGDISKEVSMFRMSCAAAVLFLFEFIFTLVTQEGVARVKIKKSQFPGLYYVLLIGIIISFIISIIGIFVYA